MCRIYVICYTWLNREQYILSFVEIYSKVAQNSVVQARPAILHFVGFELNTTQKLLLQLANVSGDVQRMHIIPPQTKYFYIKYNKNVSTHIWPFKPRFFINKKCGQLSPKSSSHGNDYCSQSTVPWLQKSQNFGNHVAPKFIFLCANSDFYVHLATKYHMGTKLRPACAHFNNSLVLDY